MRRHAVRAGFTARRQLCREMAWAGDKKAFCVQEFAKTESIVTVQRRFRTTYHTEPPTDKTIRAWYNTFRQRGCLCVEKRRGRPGPSAKTVERVRETFVRTWTCCNRKVVRTSFFSKTEPLHTSIRTFVLTSILIFQVVGLGARLTMTQLFFPGLHGHRT
jgi:hypothetical protein